MRKITDRQFEALQTIEKYIKEKGYPPTYRELMRMLGVTSPSTVKGLLDALRRKEYVTWEAGSPRTLRIMHR
ncbi:transcriptional regulator [Bacillus subtilis]|uniref:LexA family protein n=1 Tax=Bacillus subtilis group TaxID=653685 RepID=UPI00080CBB7B|nr:MULTISPECIES: transcriptional regulator [Bacillus subtilis group]MCB4338737.1 Transcription regulator LexA [Bacillus subtilis]MDK7656990.1 transcriptional regulator [Bacillus subtilis]OCB96010.1 Repressor LexA [Bacillus amyloliquefaciens]